MTFSLRGESISTSGDVILNITDIGYGNANALACHSENASREVSIYPNWFIDPNGTHPVTNKNTTRLRSQTFDLWGWDRDRASDGDDEPHVVYLKRQSDTALEGYFTCQIGSDTNPTRGLFILYPCELLAVQCMCVRDIQFIGYWHTCMLLTSMLYFFPRIFICDNTCVLCVNCNGLSMSLNHVVSVPTISVRVVSRRNRTYTVTCTVTGGRLSSSSLTGPGLDSSGLSLQRQGSSSDRGQNTYSRTSGTLSDGVGSVYTCTVMNDVSSSETSLELDGINSDSICCIGRHSVPLLSPPAAGDPTLDQPVQISPTAVRVTWSQPSGGATVIDYTVHYTRDDGTARRINDISPNTATADITGLTNSRTYTITVEAVANGLSGESEERTITLREKNILLQCIYVCVVLSYG